MHIKSIDYVEFYVGNAMQAAHYYRTAFGFTTVAVADLKTGDRERTSIIVRQNGISLILTSALSPESPISEFVKVHGDSIRDIALKVDDAAQAFEQAVVHGASPVMPPTEFRHNGQRIVKATVGIYGDCVHTFIEDDGADDAMWPGYLPCARGNADASSGLAAIDHIAMCVEPQALERLVGFYTQALGFEWVHKEDIVTGQSAMNSKVVQNREGSVKFAIMEPNEGFHTSQIQEYLTFHHGPGVQHIAMLSDNIVKTVRALSANGVEFLTTPGTYYDTLEERVGRVEVDLAELRDLNILVDRDAGGWLFQIFSKPLYSRPTAFIEVIERRGSRGFGSRNIKALFEAVELEQASRGTL